MFGKIKEYNIFEITKKVIEKEKWSFSEFDEKIVTEIEEALVDGGFVFGIGKKENKVKIAKGIYIFKLTKNEDEKERLNREANISVLEQLGNEDKNTFQHLQY